MTALLQALCCICGQLRTCRRPRNQITDCGMDTVTWHRMTGDLKCTNCGTITRHAIMRGDKHRDYAETYQAQALGRPSDDRLIDVDRIRREYRTGLPRNPRLSHRYWIDEAKAAFEAGDHTVAALCGEPLTLDFNPNTSSTPTPRTQLVKPDRIDSATEFEDPDTGLWWVDMDCVDCLAISNRKRLEELREAVKSKMLSVSIFVDQLSGADVVALNEHLEHHLNVIRGGRD